MYDWHNPYNVRKKPKLNLSAPRIKSRTLTFSTRYWFTAPNPRNGVPNVCTTKASQISVSA